VPAPSFVVFSGVRSLRLELDAAADNLVVEFLAARKIPLVLCSGRTRAELEYVQNQIGMVHPFIAEHGAAVFVRNGCFPDQLLGGARTVGDYSVLEFGRPYCDVVDAVQRAAAKARATVVSFSQMSIDEVAPACGVTPLKARLAKLRDYEEAFRVANDDGPARQRVRRHLQWAQMSWVQEGAFDFAGSPVDLGVGSQWLTALYRRARGPTVTIGLADQFHHLPFLRRVDVPIIVPTNQLVARQLLAIVPRATLAMTSQASTIRNLLAAVLERHHWTAAS